MRVLRHWCGLLSSSVFRSAASHRGVHWTAIQRPGHLTDNCKMVYFKLPAHSPHKRTIVMWSARCDILFKELYFHDRRCLVFGVGFFEIHFTPMLCSSVPLLIKPLFFAPSIFLRWRRSRKKFVRSHVSPLIELHLSAVLFCFGFSSRLNHAEFRTWKIKTPLSQCKLFKPPVVRETISIIQETFTPTGVLLAF